MAGRGKKTVSHPKSRANRQPPTPERLTLPNVQPTKEAALDLKEIRQIIELMKRNDLSLFHLERDGFKIKLRKGIDFKPARVPVPGAAPATSVAANPEPPAAAPADSSPQGTYILSPMVGTFYRSSGPGEKPFVNVGDTVDENTTVCIIEAMKVMNEIKAERKGTITRIMVDDAIPVQFDSPLFQIQPL
jgi:acetyl-CoA carboxylase biotin carboxyl carrier protein